MTEPFLIRAARPTDRRDVEALCGRIWSDDYIGDVFDDWVRDRRGRLWVAVSDGHVVGIAKLTVHANGESWLHGLRVHPDHRRRGIATALLEHRLARARALGARVSRLDTAADNVAIQRLMGRYGFRRIARVAGYAAPAAAGERPRLATRRDLPALRRLAREQRAMVHEPHFVRELVSADLTGAIRLRRAYAVGPVGDPFAFALVDQLRDREHGARLLAQVIAGTPAGMRDLLRGLRAEARALRLGRAGIAAPDRQWGVVRAAGYRRRWPETMFVFERRLVAAAPPA